MKVFEAVCLCRPLLESLERNGVDMSDIEYLDIYLEYRRRKDEGEKVTYIMSVLSEANKVSERTLYRAFSVFNRELR